MSTSEGQNFEVQVESFAKRHFIKSFRKKYKRAWDVTENALVAEFQRIDNILGCADYIEVIKSNCDLRLIKLYFKIAGSNESKKGSGNRAVAVVDFKTRVCRLLLIYSKNDICPPNETQKWENMVKVNYPDIWKNFIA